MNFHWNIYVNCKVTKIQRNLVQEEVLSLILRSHLLFCGEDDDARFIKPCCGFKSPSLHLMKYSHEYTWLIELLVPVSFLLWQSGWSTRLLIWSLIFLLGGWWVNTCTGEIWNTSSGWNHKMKLHWSFFSCDCNQIKCHKTTRIH